MWSYNEESGELYWDWRIVLDIWETSKPILMCKFNWGSWISDKVQLHKVTPRARERMHHLSVPIKQREKHEISIPALLPNIAVWGFWIILQFAATQRTLHKFSVQTKWLHRSIHRKSSRFSQVKNLKPKKKSLLHKTKILCFPALWYAQIRKRQNQEQTQSFRSCGKWMQSQSSELRDLSGAESSREYKSSQGNSPMYVAFLL